MNKSKLHFETFSNILNRILNDSNPDILSLSVIQGLLLHTVGKYDISAQKICHLLLDLLLYHSSH